MSETVELLREALDGWKKSNKQYDELFNEILPKLFVLAFFLGSEKNKKDFDYLLKHERLNEPYDIPFIDELFIKGIKQIKNFFETVKCPSCGKEHTKNEDLKFCSACGANLNRNLLHKFTT